MPIKLLTGYSRETVNTNISTLYKDGFTQRSAVAASLAFARVCFFKRFPAGLLDHWLAQHGYRRKVDYDADGHLRALTDYERTYEAEAHGVHNEPPRNPVGRLQISAKERRTLLKSAENDFSGMGADVREAAKLFADFTGHEPKIDTEGELDIPRVLRAWGDCCGILYDTVRDGNKEGYIHAFKKSARPGIYAPPSMKLFDGGQYTDYRNVVKKSDVPNILMNFGKCAGIQRLNHGGVIFTHKFPKGRQPLITVSPDGKTIYLVFTDGSVIFLLGGNYQFGRRGIVDAA